MTRHPLIFVALLFALPACSTDPSPPGASDAAGVIDAADVSDVASELARDASSLADSDAPALDVPRDAGQLDAAPDRVELVDAADAAVGADAADAQPDVAADAGSDATDAAVAADAADGAVTYDLNRPYDAVEFHALYTSTCVPGECANSVVDTITGTSQDCYVSAGEMHFTVSGMVGVVTLARDAGAGSGVVSFGPQSTVAPVLTAGRAFASSGARQNFHVQFSIPAGPSARGRGGVPGRTTSPDLADVWALGCPVR